MRRFNEQVLKIRDDSHHGIELRKKAVFRARRDHFDLLIFAKSTTENQKRCVLPNRPAYRHAG